MLLGAYVLILGLVAGLLLGPLVLGNVMPQRYALLFPSPKVILAKRTAIEQTRKTLEMTDVSLTALAEYDQQRQAEWAALNAQLLTVQKRQATMNTLILASLCGLLVMNMTARQSRLFTRLHFAVHLLLAGWLALLMAQPYLLAHMTGLLMLGALLMVLFVGLIQYGKCKTTPDTQPTHTHAH